MDTDWQTFGLLVSQLHQNGDREDLRLGRALYIEHQPRTSVECRQMYSGWVQGLPLGPDAPAIADIGDTP